MNIDSIDNTQTENISTNLTDDVGSGGGGGGKVDTFVDEPQPDAPAKPESVRDSLTAELKKEITKEENPVETEAKEEKPKEENVKPVKAEKVAKPSDEEDEAGEREADKSQRKSEVRERPEPPARFLPKAKELWRNTPNEVQLEVSRIVKDHEAEVEKYRESQQFREELREYEELGRKHGVTLKQALENYVGIERKFADAPADGFKQLLSNLQMQPQQAISHILSAFNVTPQALAQHMAQNPQAYQVQQPVRTQQVQPQTNQEVEQLKVQLQDMQTHMAHQQYIAPFIAKNPRYYELEQDIAFFLKSGKIPASLSPAEKLAAAYDMAERINPSSNIETFPARQDKTPSRVDDDFNGSKSIKSSPGNVVEKKDPEKKLSMRELLEDELKRLKKA